MDNKLLTAKEVAELLQLNPQTIRRWCKRGLIKHIKFGNHIRIRPLELEKFIEQRTKGVK